MTAKHGGSVCIPWSHSNQSFWSCERVPLSSSESTCCVTEFKRLNLCIAHEFSESQSACCGTTLLAPNKGYSVSFCDCYVVFFFFFFFFFVAVHVLAVGIAFRFVWWTHTHVCWQSNFLHTQRFTLSVAKHSISLLLFFAHFLWKTDNAVFGWGKGKRGRLGIAEDDDVFEPRLIALNRKGKILSLCSSHGGTMLITEGEFLWEDALCGEVKLGQPCQLKTVSWGVNSRSLKLKEVVLAESPAGIVGRGFSRLRQVMSDVRRKATLH